MSPAKFRAAAVHAAPVYMNKGATIEKAVRLIQDAGKQDIKLLVFPETFIPGYPYFIECYPPLKYVPVLAKYAQESFVVFDPTSSTSPPQPSHDLQLLQSACRAAGVTVSIGVSERSGSTLFNSQVNISSSGTLLGVHRKLQPTYVERAVWAQGGGATLKTWRVPAGAADEYYNLGGLCCWEHTMNGARQALIECGQHVHAGAWPALSTMAGFEGGADAQIEALMKSHALTAQVFVVCASNPVDDTCLQWMQKELGEQGFVKEGGGWSAVIHPFCVFLGGPHTGKEGKLIVGEIDLEELGAVKVWVDAAGHYKRPEVLGFQTNRKMIWDDEKYLKGRDDHHGEDAVEKAVGQGRAPDKATNVRGTG